MKGSGQQCVTDACRQVTDTGRQNAGCRRHVAGSGRLSGARSSVKLSCLKPLSHWAATVADKLRKAFAREFPKCLETFAGVLNFLA